uniref:F-box protein n=1 Tax=Kalanchoe fedtschenkoi TaxID=63787 RepID=A0A7N0U6C2_KALFE
MDTCDDLTQRLGLDMSIKVLTHLASPYDLVRFSSVSRRCHQFVIAHGLCKHLCLKMFPEMASLGHAIKERNLIQPLEGRLEDATEPKWLERSHRIYSFLAQGLAPDIKTDCIAEAICASSTDNFPEESVENTLEPDDKSEQRASYWSSKGEADPNTPETLIYRLKANLCIVTEIHVQPLQAFFQLGAPIYSARSVRFRLGHRKCPLDQDDQEMSEGLALSADEFTWTYVSPEFPMIQKSCLQVFKLPEPALCVGGVIQVELLGRLQRQEMDDLFYIWCANFKT